MEMTWQSISLQPTYRLFPHCQGKLLLMLSELMLKMPEKQGLIVLPIPCLPNTDINGKVIANAQVAIGQISACN